MATIYLLHFSRPISDKHTTQHYLGFAGKGIQRRLAEHESGAGARLTQVAKERGIGWTVARTWTGAGSTRTEERRLKNLHAAPRLCPICRAAKKGA